MRIKASILLSALLIMSLLFSGCGSKEEKAPQEGGSETKPLKVALILPGKIDDVSWNQAMYEGVKALEEEYKAKSN
ncbi:hypothetical protein N752_01340 [Desulforamulus aquiferis]|nr:BMP family ABC transporter substrate-binding protein [Desulforamulus aquiferis]RYD06963.1 hypothetical protein N752_01340 [Desulforamulus aquiferis]